MKVIGARAPLVLCIFTGILLSEAVNHMLAAGAFSVSVSDAVFYHSKY
jgi:hypothetical protein